MLLYLLQSARSIICVLEQYFNVVTLIAKGKIYVQTFAVLQTGHITLSSTPDQQIENHSTKYHRQQPLYNTFELLMMGIVVPETC